MYLEIDNLHKIFGDNIVLDRINLKIDSGEFVCLLGPSGCGKTTLLRIIAGLLPADGGKLTLEGKNLISLPARERNFGIVFQSYSLFPHMTAKDNVGYGLKLRGWSKKAISQRAVEMLELINLADMANRYPHQLSGGQQQRIALARALAIDPSIILLDEPLSALDAKVREKMRMEIKDVQQRLGIPILMVTHDQEEALALADKVVCMNNGMIEQIGRPDELYLQPQTRFVADFIGASNLLPPAWVKQHLPEAMATLPTQDRTEYFLCIRPEFIIIDESSERQAKVKSSTFHGSFNRVGVEYGGVELTVEAHNHIQYRPDANVGLSFNANGFVWVKS
ncbi:ABC transporter ATP-binding protein [Vreelandella nigrificans]|uniref:ABC transporter ATP-binding protein n=1 Tax=Vreelandella nigrificans TaxID=2042704 RepID=A0A2A4HJE2_9GAMM|nr:ABC transporter ATP-binding protein [Halomonas nigrificans]PCF94221.1 ABC transporter ATP-binding protein [Halomonas nigrificans]